MAEIELGVLDRQWLDRRTGAMEILDQESLAGRINGTARQFRWSGASPPRMPASDSNPYTHQSNADGLPSLN